MASVPIAVSPRAVSPVPRWEMSVRYAAAYACTLLAILASWPRIATPFAFILIGATLLGLPLSLGLRRSGLRLGRRRISRPVFNAFVVTITMLASAGFLWFSLHGGGGLMQGGRLFDFNVGRGIELLIGVFLLFAVCRCLFILTDKDALLCTVPSFSVLLLLIVAQREATIVVYFLLWSLATAVLLALDHRGEVRLGLSGTVPAVVPGQEISLPARSLGGVILFSLLCSTVLAYGLASTSSQNRSRGENWIIELISRWSNVALDESDVSLGSALPRRIDFASGPVLPTRRLLWRVRAVAVDSGQELRPVLWRSYSLSHYDGKSWTQGGPGETARRDAVPVQKLRLMAEIQTPDGRHRRLQLRGYDLARYRARRGIAPNQFGRDGVRVSQRIVSLSSHSGYLPSLPSADLVTFPRAAAQPRLFSSPDASIEVGALQPDDGLFVESRVPLSPEYGVVSDARPRREPQSPAQRSEPIRLSASERRANLQLPPRTLLRLKPLVQRVLRTGSADDIGVHPGDEIRAQRLARFVQNRATYTLHPPVTPPDRDAAEYFLFDSRRGYCTYFAGALTVLCRASGIPARVVSGYANPEWERDGGEPGAQEGALTGTLREANGHAWTEIWVDNRGWMPVDATPSDDRGDNAPGLMGEAGDLLGSLLARAWKVVSLSAVQGATWMWSHAVALSLLFPIAFMLLWLRAQKPEAVTSTAERLFGWLRGSKRRQKAMPSPDAQARLSIRSDYARAARELSRRFRPRAIGETSHEWLRASESAWVLRDPQPLRTLTNLNERASYREREMGENEQLESRRALEQLSWEREAVVRQVAAT